MGASRFKPDNRSHLLNEALLNIVGLSDISGEFSTTIVDMNEFSKEESGDYPYQKLLFLRLLHYIRS